VNPTQLSSSVSQLPAGRARRNVLVVALADDDLDDAPDGHVLVVAPALNSWLRRWLSDEDPARRRAERRVVGWLDRLERRGVVAEGRVGDGDPVRAIADALAAFPADEIVLAAGPCGRPEADDWLVRARERFAGLSIRIAQPLLRAA